jgi:hypothetical protein
MLTVLGGLAEFERELIRARTGEGRKRAKASGVEFGRPAALYRGFQQRQVSYESEASSRCGCAVAASGECSLGWILPNILRRVCRVPLVQHSVSVKG